MSGEAWLSVWAKTGRDPGTNAISEWLPLHQHLADAAGVAALLVDHWVPSRVMRRIASSFGGTNADVRLLATWLAGVHDVGKASPAFAVMAPELTPAMSQHGLVADPLLRADPQRSRVRHEIVGQVTVRNWLRDELAFTNAEQLAVVVGGHHGAPPDKSRLSLARKRPDLAGRGAWVDVRLDILRRSVDLAGGEEALGRYANASLDRPAQALLTAIVIVADWIASNTQLFPVDPLHVTRPPDERWTADRVRRGWAQLDLQPRWTPHPIGDPQATFVARFRHQPRPVQLAAVEMAAAQPEPGLVVIEAPMGEGKTEAALLAAEVLAARSGADGCFIALPTRATSDAMFPRVLSWMRALPGIAGDVSVMLAHGTATLNDDFRPLLTRGRIRQVGEGCDEAGVAHHWLRGRKKGQLAQFVVGTVDQVLFAGLKSRHLMLRHLALAGKVVVVDEVHAYDVFMSRYLDRVLHWLGSYGTPVVLLSATLPPTRRAELLAAYASGRGDQAEPTALDSAYPLVSASGLAPRPVGAGMPSRTVALAHLPDDLDDLVALLRERLTGGGCAVVVRNTVRRVQEAADRLVQEFGEDDVTVSHSRFLACDRARLDAELLRRFGPPGNGRRRPHRHIVVASQVVEQSLDADFDLMVTDLAPVDLVLQRMGRLHRHVRPRPGGLTEPQCVLVGVEDWTAAPVRAVAGSTRVYGEHSLLRAAALLHDRAVVTLPDDLAPLVHAAYGKGTPGPPSWHSEMAAAAERDRKAQAERRERAATFLLGEVGGPSASLVSWVSAGAEDLDDQRNVGHVRDGAETLEVLVVQRDAGGGITTPDWSPRAGVPIPRDFEVPADVARTVAACALRLPIEMSLMNEVGDGVLRALERNHYASFDRSPLLSGQLVLVLDGDRRAEIRHGAAAFRLTYDLRRGLLHEAI